MELYEDSRVPTRQIDMRPRTSGSASESEQGNRENETEGNAAREGVEEKEEKSFIFALCGKKRSFLESVKMAEQVGR